jgi:mannan endo-1,4-beta-mannosidase
MTYQSCNPNLQPEAKKVLQYLSDLRAKGIVTGQHTQTMEQAELGYIREVTGKDPALCGFELLGYSPNIDYDGSGEECLTEVEENKGTLEKVWEWAERKGLITFTWHWFSPLGGSDKAFYQRNTPFDARLVLVEGTPEREAFFSDMDVMAELLKPFCEKHIPILWRPFHETEGDWFWWGHHGADTAKKLYRTMYERYTAVHRLDNLIWVWNSPVAEGYVGDDVCDVISRDVYIPVHEHSDYSEKYEELIKITPARKITALGETGPLPDMAMLSETSVPWTWYMTWSNNLCREGVTSREVLKAMYEHPYAVTLDKLPTLY